MSVMEDARRKVNSSREPSPNGKPEPVLEALPIVAAADLVRTYPHRRPPVIEGLLREGETMNLIAGPKVGKSWLSLGLAFTAAHGLTWLDFKTHKAPVLVIDNELHPETSAHRLRKLGEALLLSPAGIDLCNLRGRLQDLITLSLKLKQIEPGRYGLIIVDAFYRTLPQKTDENDNATMAGLYNILDGIAEQIRSSFVLIHHSSKGNQSSKALTDVGSGAGSMSRATDTHVILRPHEADNAVVLEAAVRSWPPVAPLCLRWDFPTWRPAPDLDPTDLRQEKPRRRNKPEGLEEIKPPKEPPWTAERFAKAFGRPEPRFQGVIVEEALARGLSERKAIDLLKRTVDMGFLFSWQEKGTYGKRLYATEKPPEFF